MSNHESRSMPDHSEDAIHTGINQEFLKWVSEVYGEKVRELLPQKVKAALSEISSEGDLEQLAWELHCELNREEIAKIGDVKTNSKLVLE